MPRSPLIVALNENHDASVAIWGPGVPIAALATERLTRQKHDVNGVIRTIDHLLSSLNIEYEQVGLVVRCSDPVAIPPSRLTERTAELHRRFPSASFLSAPNHHKLHALAARQMDPGRKGAILVVDGMGSKFPSEYNNNADPPLHECATIFSTPTVRRLYSAATTYSPYQWQEEKVGLGRFYSYISKHIFGSRYDAGKTMALAAYGRAGHVPSFLSYVGNPPVPYVNGLALSGLSIAPGPRDDYLQFAQIAARAQADVEEGMLALARIARTLVDGDALFISGGVALNCPSNLAIQKSGLFSRTFIHPAATDDGVSLGGLVLGAQSCGLAQALPRFTGRFLGPPIASQRNRLLEAARDVGCHVVCDIADALLPRVAQALLDGELVALYDAESEFGPRALGHRSLIADPRRPTTRDFINSKVKGREAFRPLAPVTFQDRVADFFEVDADFHNPYMLLVARAKPVTREAYAAAVHVDGSARVQTITRGQRPQLLGGILTALESRGHAPMLLNTSLNGPGEPIVETPEEAIAFFQSYPIDLLFSHGVLISKEHRKERGCPHVD
jgi:carbamoyltransferase